MELLLLEWEKKLSIFETPFRTKKHELASILRLGLQIWPPNSFLPEVSGWQFPRSRLRLKTGLGTMAIWNLWLLQTRCLGNQQPEELDPLDLGSLGFSCGPGCLSMLVSNTTKLLFEKIDLRRPLGRLMGYSGLAGKFPARKWPIVLKLSNFSYDGHFVISPILSRHG